MSRTTKLVSVLMIAIMIILLGTTCFATDASGILEKVNTAVGTANPETDGLAAIAGKVIKFIQVLSVIIGAVLIAFFGIKFILGSAEEKAEYKKSFMPFIIGIIVVMAATSIARLLFTLFT